MRLNVEVSPDRPLATNLGANVVLSPDGRVVVFAAGSPSAELDVTRRNLFVRRLESNARRRDCWCQNAYSPFISPDGGWVGYFTAARLMNV